MVWVCSFINVGGGVVIVTIINMWLSLGNDCGLTNKVDCCLVIQKEKQSNAFFSHLSIKCVTVTAAILSNIFKVALKKVELLHAGNNNIIQLTNKTQWVYCCRWKESRVSREIRFHVKNILAY